MFSFWCLFWLLVLSCYFFYFLLPPCLIIFSCVHWCLIPNQSTVFVLLCSPWSLIVLLCCAALFFLHFLPGSLFVCELFFSHFFLPLVVHLSLLPVPWVFPVCFLSEDRKIGSCDLHFGFIVNRQRSQKVYYYKIQQCWMKICPFEMKPTDIKEWIVLL